MGIKEALTYNDVLLVPQYSDIKTRHDIHIGSSFPGPPAALLFDLPIIASPMDTVSEATMAITMWRSGAFAVIHRYNTIEEQAALVDEVVVGANASTAAAIGASGDYFQQYFGKCL